MDVHPFHPTLTLDMVVGRVFCTARQIEPGHYSRTGLWKASRSSATKQNTQMCSAVLETDLSGGQVSCYPPEFQFVHLSDYLVNIFLAGPNRSRKINQLFKQKLDPKPNYPNLWKLILICILIFFFLSCKLFKISEKWFTDLFFFEDLLITPSRGWQREAEGDMIKWHTLRIQRHLFLDRSSDYIQDLTWFCSSMYTMKGRQPHICLLFSYCTHI